MNVLDLFAGVGGFSLGLERAGMSTVAFCEIEEYPRRVLAKHWPEVPIYDDVRNLTGQRLRRAGISVDLICGGFPCQDISTAADAPAGLAGERSGLWSDFARLIREIGPKWVIVENVSALRGSGLDAILRDLASIGYDAEWHCIPASAVGAPHPRDRVWIVANAQEMFGSAQCGDQPSRLLSRNGLCSIIEDEGRQDAIKSWWSAEPVVDRLVHGVPSRVDRLGVMSNAVVPQIPEAIGRAIMVADRNHRKPPI